MIKKIVGPSFRSNYVKQLYIGRKVFAHLNESQQLPKPPVHQNISLPYIPPPAILRARMLQQLIIVHAAPDSCTVAAALDHITQSLHYESGRETFFTYGGFETLLMTVESFHEENIGAVLELLLDLVHNQGTSLLSTIVEFRMVQHSIS
jgi:hypothetical protein